MHVWFRCRLPAISTPKYIHLWREVNKSVRAWQQQSLWSFSSKTSSSSSSFIPRFLCPASFGMSVRHRNKYSRNLQPSNFIVHSFPFTFQHCMCNVRIWMKKLKHNCRINYRKQVLITDQELFFHVWWSLY